MEKREIRKAQGGRFGSWQDGMRSIDTTVWLRLEEEREEEEENENDEAADNGGVDLEER